MEVKRVQADIKLLDDKGSFRAIFSTLGVTDLDGDVTLPGAFEQGAGVKVSAWGHNWNALPVGTATIRSDDREAWADGQFFLSTTSGKEHYEVAKQLGPTQEWSYGYTVLKSHDGSHAGRPVRFLDRLAVHEVSQVMLGAGVNTRTVSVRAADPELVALRRKFLAAELRELEAEERQLTEVKAMLAANEIRYWQLNR